MNKIEAFLKYIDKELSDKEIQEVNHLLATDDDAKTLFDKIKQDRDNTLEILEQFNPKRAVEIPPFSKPAPEKNLRFQFLRVAALIVVLLGISISLLLLTDNGKSNQDEVMVANTEQKIIYEELDYYISPNRCWNQRQMVWIVNETK